MTPETNPPADAEVIRTAITKLMAEDERPWESLIQKLVTRTGFDRKRVSVALKKIKQEGWT